ncbi:MAG TPA: TAT-variant-translocated molybdopterin oxidoreductase [Chthonomonadaceae bacterium]|nr:TAT-variant-translocated molybdopterin oxidoreductase [Chthonomonadaceae bacterium]
MQNNEHKRLDLKEVRAKLEGKRGPQYWRCLEELAETEEFQEFLLDEFPQQARGLMPEMDRRKFLMLSAASLALAGLSGCRFLPARKIVPYVQRPDEIIPGKPLFYASVHPFNGDAIGIIVTSHEGRPTKIEGNPDHPASLGATDAITQASILNLYDPDRAQNVTNLGQISTWDDFLKAARDTLARPGGGAGLRILTGNVTSPTLADQIATLTGRYPGTKWHQYEPVNRDNVYAGTRLLFGAPLNPVYRFDRANVILSLDSNFLLSMPGHVRYAHDFGNARRVRSKAVSTNQPAHNTMNRLYAIDSMPNITGAMADHRIPVRASEVEAVAFALAQQLGVAGVTAPGPLPASVPPQWLSGLVQDLQANRGACVVVPGDHQSPAVHALAHAMNAALGAAGTTVVYTDPVEISPADNMASLRDLVNDMQAGKVTMLLIIGGNPVYDAPVDLNFKDQLTKVPLTAHLGLFDDETSARCRWHLPETHYLEAWSDARAFDGTTSIVQPLIAPLYDNRSAHEVLSELTDTPGTSLDIVQGYWRRTRPSPTFDAFWEKVVHDGLIPGTALPARTPAAGRAAAITPSPPSPSIGGGAGGEYEIAFMPDPTIWDGRFANNGWLQELPKTLSRLVWDNAAFMSFATAEALHLTTEDMVALNYRGQTLPVAVYAMPGHPDNAVTISLGYGRERGGRNAEEAGFNAYALRTSDAPWFGPGLSITKTGGRYFLVGSHMRNSINMAGRDPVQHATLQDFIKNPDFVRNDAEVHDPPLDESFYGDAHTHEHKYEGFGTYAWGMSIDNNVCIGCNACVVACQAENNIPVVGKDQVSRGREMHWLRIDRYFGTGRSNTDYLANPRTYFQPIPCMHCELAPCEPVCPVAATVHSAEGLNMMVYNRCVGTRYCSNNCPYKVRRFNFYKYAAGQPNRMPGNFDLPTIQLVANPEVTIRGRGVMEKCSYCVQRIDMARIEAKKADDGAGREIQDGEVLTACQQACPTNAIVFGNIKDANSQVKKLKDEPQDYSLLGELNTRPRTTYLAKFTNPNTAIDPADSAEAEEVAS